MQILPRGAVPTTQKEKDFLMVNGWIETIDQELTKMDIAKKNQAVLEQKIIQGHEKKVVLETRVENRSKKIGTIEDNQKLLAKKQELLKAEMARRKALAGK